MRDIDKFEILIYFFHELYALCCRPVTSLGHQAGRRVFWEGPKSVKQCPTHFSRGSEKFCSGSEASPRPALITGLLCCATDRIFKMTAHFEILNGVRIWFMFIAEAVIPFFLQCFLFEETWNISIKFFSNYVTVLTDFTLFPFLHAVIWSKSLDPFKPKTFWWWQLKPVIGLRFIT